MELSNKIAVISGGASGMGKATLKRLLAENARVAIFDLNQEAGESIAAAYPDEVLYVSTDVSSEDSVKSAVQKVIEKFGAIHLNINCAGIATGSKTVGKEGAFPLQLWQKTLSVNLTGTFNVLRLCAEQMVNNSALTEDGCRGAIVNLASIAAFEGQVGQAAYSASKGGIVGLTLPVARDLSNYGIRVNCVAPGLIDTPMFDSLPRPVYESLAATPLFPKRLGHPEDVADMIVSLLKNDYINGECIRMDAGLRMMPK